MTYITASKGCWPADQYFAGACYGFYYNETADATLNGWAIDISYESACVSDLSSYLDDLFGDQPYLRIDYFNDTSCAELDVANIMIADGVCHMRYVTVNESTTAAMAESWITIVDESGWAWFRKYASADCTGELKEDYWFTKKQFKSHECVNSVEARVAGNGLSAGAIAGIVIGAVAFLVLVVGIVWWRHRKNKSRADETETDELGCKLGADNASELEADTLTTPDDKANAYRATKA